MAGGAFGSAARPYVSFTVFAALGLPITRTRKGGRTRALLFLLRHHEVIGLKARGPTSEKRGNPCVVMKMHLVVLQCVFNSIARSAEPWAAGDVEHLDLRLVVQCFM